MKELTSCISVLAFSLLYLVFSIKHTVSFSQSKFFSRGGQNISYSNDLGNTVFMDAVT